MTHMYAHLPPQEALVALLAAARCGSFSTAAEELGVTHGTISRRIAIVEDWMGTQMFERKARGVVLTPAGQRFAMDAERALSLLVQSADRWRPARGTARVTLSVVAAFARLWLLPRLKRLQGEDDSLHVEVATDHRPVELGVEADIAVRYTQETWSGATGYALFGEDLVPAAHPDIAAKLGHEPTASAVAGFPLIHDSNVSLWRLWLEEGGHAYRQRPVDRRFEDYDTVLAAAEAGLGVALLRRPVVEGWRASRLITLSSRAIINPRKHIVMVREGETRPAVLECVARLQRIHADDVAAAGGAGRAP
jgi:DNA-binding transcriptional LysR family regulator